MHRPTQIAKEGDAIQVAQARECQRHEVRDPTLAREGDGKLEHPYVQHMVLLNMPAVGSNAESCNLGRRSVGGQEIGQGDDSFNVERAEVALHDPESGNHVTGRVACHQVIRHLVGVINSIMTEFRRVHFAPQRQCT